MKNETTYQKTEKHEPLTAVGKSGVAVLRRTVLWVYKL